MFKKTTVVNQQKLRNDLVKRLKRDMQLLLPGLSEEDVDTCFPPKADVLMYKLSNRAVAYGVDGKNPLLFDPVRQRRAAPGPALLLTLSLRHRRVTTTCTPRCTCCGRSPPRWPA